jgi:AcrR family transcriptional regulator
LSGLIIRRLLGRNSGQKRDLNLTSGSVAINGQGEAVTVSPRVPLPTVRGRQTQAAVDAAARAVITHKGILAATISDIAAEASRSTVPVYNYYDSKEPMVREWAVRLRDEARERCRAAAQPGLSDWERFDQAVFAHWHTYRVNEDFAVFWNDICALPIALVTQMVEHAQRQGFCDDDEGADSIDDECVNTLATIFHRTIYRRAAA